MTSETVQVNKKAIADLVKVKKEFDAIVESIELMSNTKFMTSYSKAKEEIKKRDFDDWNAL
jgi:molybdenum cofactor biosynthesis enzyme MoaA